MDKEKDMATKHSNINSQEVRKRAAEIRSHWSPLERAQRTGLPPDRPISQHVSVHSCWDLHNRN
jgi:hypothetical protein